VRNSKKNRVRASSADVAKKAGVSQSAVSRAFTAGASISKDKKEKVLAAAKKLDYQPNIIARSLNQQSTKIIGIVMTRFFQTFYSIVLGEFTKKLQEKGYSVLIMNVTNDEEVERVIPMALQYQVDGIVITSASLSSKMVDSCLKFGTPLVLFNRYSANENVDAVYCDSVNGGRLAAQTLIEDGHKRFAFVCGEKGISTSRDRELGFVERLKEEGLELMMRYDGDFTYESGYEAAKHLLDRKDRPDAIFCANDLMGIGILDYAKRRLNIKIPKDLAVIGFDDTPMASWPEIRLTTISQPIPHLVDATITRLMNAINATVDETIIKKIQGTLIRRDTTRNKQK
jgi:DNA-binding LacI/PurR family transcriptional regulator